MGHQVKKYWTAAAGNRLIGVQILLLGVKYLNLRSLVVAAMIHVSWYRLYTNKSNVYFQCRY